MRMRHGHRGGRDWVFLGDEPRAGRAPLHPCTPTPWGHCTPATQHPGATQHCILAPGTTVPLYPNTLGPLYPCTPGLLHPGAIAPLHSCNPGCCILVPLQPGVLYSCIVAGLTPQWPGPHTSCSHKACCTGLLRRASSSLPHVPPVKPGERPQLRGGWSTEG